MSQSSGSNEATGIPSEAIDVQVKITNFNDEISDITNLVYGFSIYEDLFSATNSCEIMVSDAEGLKEILPIVGDEHVTITYRTRGIKKAPGEQYRERVRSFKIFKLEKVVEAAERQQSYLIQGIDDHQILNEMIDLNQSFVGQNCVTAIANIFKSNFITNVDSEFRPFDIEPKLFGLGTEDVIPSINTSFYISPGVTPFESIKYLKDEAEHSASPTNLSDYVFYQDYVGFHLTTLTELKSQKARFDFTVKDMGADADNKSKQVTGGTSSIMENSSKEAQQSNNLDQEDSLTVLNYNINKTFDTLHHLALGTYGNRIAAIDLLTKQFDEKSYSYHSEYKSLSTLHSTRLLSDPSIFKFSGSTHTRYLPTELLSNSIPDGAPKSFNNERSSYSQTPYFYPIGGSGKEEGTIKNEDANKRLQDIISKDPKINNPRRKHYILNKLVGAKGLLDSMVIDIQIPGNSDIKVGDTVNFYVPQTSAALSSSQYNLFFGQADPKFLVVKCRHAYINEVSSFQTNLTIVKDSFKDEVSTIVNKVKDYQGQSKGKN